ncbi:MAG: 30S ribosomal protein S17 [Thermoplasmata archaeon]|nr:30S ribosomal protein S17 [Thermoplasmata archaeon]
MAKRTTKTNTARDIGVDVKPPTDKCEDEYCPFHGTLPVRGTVIDGIVVSARMQGTVVVEREYLRYISKFERYEKRTSKYFAHAPPCFKLSAGDKVKIMECRPLSKKVAYVVIERRM